MSDDIYQILGRIEGTVDGIMREQQRLARYTENTSTRLRRVEDNQQRMFGMAGTVSAIVGIVVSLLVAFVRRFV
ncbi:MAG TPA: hypothetical protein VMX57_00195 [Planctomycetota bacterium]|nr:hypothetical protein [Planctomycetota bacterium]